MGKRIVIALTVLVMALAPVMAGDQVLTYSHFANAGPLNPHLYSPNQMYAQEMVYEPLVAWTTDNSLEPCLAESWEISEDGTRYRFHLRSGVVFSDGQPFTALAVVKNFDAIMANRQRHAWLALTEKIESYRAVDDMTFELILCEPYYPTLHDLSLPRPYRFLSPAAIPNSGTTKEGIMAPVGTGPWKLDQSLLGIEDIFVRNESYWGDQPSLDKIVIKIIPDPMSRAMALETGEIDFIYGQGQIPFDIFSAYRSNPTFETHTSSAMGGVAVAINTGQAPTNDIRVRQAIQHLSDRAGLVRGILLDTQPIAPYLLSPDLPYCDIDRPPYAYDPAKAVALLEEAGWLLEPGGSIRRRGGEELTATFCYIGNDPVHKAIAEVLQAQAAAVGMHLTLLGEEEDMFLRRQKDGTFGMIINVTWGPPFEPHAMLGSMRQPSHADYQAQAGLPMKGELDSMITRVLSVQDEDERALLYREILSVLHDQVVYLPIHYNSLLAVFRRGSLDGFQFGPGKSKYPFERIVKVD